MKSPVQRLIRLALASILTLVCGLVATANGASAMAACASCPTLTASDAWGKTSYNPGGYVRVAFDLENPTDKLMRDVTLHITIPAGSSLDLGWGGTVEPDNGTFSYDEASRSVAVQPTSSVGDVGFLNPFDKWTFWLYIDFDKALSVPSLSVSSYLTWTDSTGKAGTRVNGKDVVYTKAEPYILDTTTSFSPAIIASGGSSVMTSTITNSGTGGARSIYFYMRIDDRLTVDQSTVPADCTYYPRDTWESWDGRIIVDPQHLSCSHSPVLGPGQSITFSITVTAPVTPGPEEYEGITELSCTSPANGAYEGDFESQSAGLLRLGPATPAELKVVQLGGPKPITMPTATAEPIQPTAGDSHSMTTYVYNVGTNDLTNAVTVVITIPSGFTPTRISGTTDDSGGTAPVCTLATRTCVFSQLAGGKFGRIVVEGDLSSTIPHRSKLDVSATASAASVASASDTASLAVTALANVRVALEANGAYRLGSPVQFTLGASNLGPSAAKQSVATVTIPNGATFTSVPTGCTVSNHTMTCTWASLAVGAGETRQFSASFGQAGTAGASVVFTTSTPLTKNSVTRASDSREQASWAQTRAIEAALGATDLPATGGNSARMILAALVLLASGASLAVLARRRRIS